jgi:CxxC-x17-CxxC domain-containing protein
MGFMNKSIRCSDCGTTFAFSAVERYFFVSKGFTNEPKRCPSCRQARKSEGYRDWSYGRSIPRQMFRTTCTHCGKDTEVPFEPRAGSRPVCCSHCYHKRRLSNLVDRCIVAITSANAHRVGSTGLALSTHIG